MSSWSFSKKGVVFLLLVIVLIGILLRLHDLGKENLWTDEAFSLHHAMEDDLTSLSEQVAETEAAPLGYYVLLHYWVKLFGSSEFSARMPSVIFGVLSIFMIFILTRQFFDRKVALLSSFFLATSMLQVLYSQEARLYSMFTFITLLSTYFFSKWFLLEKEGKKSNFYLISYTLSILFAVYTNYLAVVLILIYTFVLFFEWKTSKNLFKRWIFTHSSVLLLSLPLLPNLLTQYFLINNGLSGTLISKGMPSVLAKTGIFFFAVPFVIILSIFITYILSNKLKKILLNNSSNDKSLAILILLFSISYIYLAKYGLYIFGINVIPNPITNSYFLIRHPYFLVTIFYVYLAYRLVNMKSKKLSAFCLIMILIVNVFSLITYYDTTTKAEWEEAMLHIESKGGTPLVLVDKGGFSNIFLLEYYSQKFKEIVRLTWSNRTEGRGLKTINLGVLDQALRGEDDFWLVLARGGSDYYKNYLDERHQLIEEKEFYEITLYHYSNNDLKTNNFI